MIFVLVYFPALKRKPCSYILKWWCLPLFPDWINFRKYNHLIGYISNSNFQIQNHFHAFISLCIFTFVFAGFLLQNIFFKLINIFVFFVFILIDAFGFPILWFHKKREIDITKKENFSAPAWTLAKFYLREWNRRPGRAVSLHLSRSGSQSEHRIHRILPTRGACRIVKYKKEVALHLFLLLLFFVYFLQCVAKT